MACTVFALLGLALPDSPYAPLAAAVGCMAATAFLTAGAHENGLVRTMQGLAAGRPRETVLAAMKEPRTDSAGVLTLFLTLSAKVSLLAVLASQSPAAVLVAILVAQVVSRFWPLWVARTLPYLGDEGAADARLLSERIDVRGLAVAAAWTSAALAIGWLAQGFSFVLMAVLVSGLAWWWIRTTLARRLQGFTGESLDATQQLCEIGCYLGAAIGLAVG